MKIIRIFILSLIGILLLASCGDILEIPETIKPTEMTLDRHRLVVMVGDSVRVSPLFQPDSISNFSVWWQMADEETATVRNGMVYGRQLGNTILRAKSVLNELTDSCAIIVIDNWSSFRHDFYRYDMVVYAHITKDGNPLPDNMSVAALCGDEVRGIGIRRNIHDIDYWEIRVYSNKPDGEIIHFVGYQPGMGTTDFATSLPFDEEAHGTLSNLFIISD